MPRKPMKEFAPGYGFAKSDWDDVADNPEQTPDQLKAMRPFAEVFPDLAARAEAGGRRGRGKQKAPTKQLVSIRLDRDVVEAFRSAGDGWQARVNDALRKAAKLGRKPAA
jgi:uncharacterized protein (DUF4415 family)